MSLLRSHSHASILSCSPPAPSAREEARHRVGARWWIWLMNIHPNPLRFPYVEIKAPPQAVVEEEEPQDSRSFDLCCHVSSSDCTQIEGIRKPLTFTHGARFPLQLYPRWQNRGLDLQLGGCQGREISFHQNIPPFASFLSLPSSFSGSPSCGQAEKGSGAKHRITSVWAHFALAQAAKGSS